MSKYITEESLGNGAKSYQDVIRAISSLAMVHWRLLAIASLLSLAVSLLWMLPPFLISQVIDRAILGGDSQLLLILSGGLLGAALMIALFSFAQEYFVTVLGERMIRSLRIGLFEALQRQSHRFFVRTASGSIASRMWNDVSGVHQAVSSELAEIFSAIVLLVVTLSFMFAWDWQLTLLSISLLPIVFCVSLYMGKLAEAAGNRLFSTLDKLTTFTYERFSISGFTLLSGFGYDRSKDSKQFAKDTNELLTLSVRHGMALQVVGLTVGLYAVLASVLVYFFGGLRVIDGDLSLGTLTAFIALSARLAWPIADMSRLAVSFAGSMAPFKRVFEWTDLTPDIADADDARPLSLTQGHIAFKDVSFEYEPGTPVLRNLSFEVQPGQLVALVGLSGTGKTTVTHLLLRFYDATSGRIEIDGTDVRQVKLSSLRQRISIVPQESIVFNTTVRENLLIAKPNATDDELAAACKAAQLQECINGLPDGYDSLVGEFGYNLSGGERQRLAIARAALKQPRLLIMDEPTSSLDSITERAVRDSLSAIIDQSTTIVIAHRLSTVLAADIILVLDEGRCIDSGGHDELIARCNLYRRLYEEQFAHQLSGRDSEKPARNTSDLPHETSDIDLAGVVNGSHKIIPQE